MKAVRGNYYSTFNPLSLPQCALWLDADDPDEFSFSSGSNISFWRDKSPLAHDVCASGTPQRVQNVWNSKPGVFFNGTSFLSGNIATNTSNQLTGFVVADISINQPQWGRIVSLGAAGQADSTVSTRVIPFLRLSNSSNLIAFRNNTQLGTVAITYGVPFVACSTFTGASNTIFRNSTAGTAVASSGNFGYSRLGIGKDSGTDTAIHVGYIYEVLLYNYLLSSNERQTVEGYLAYKWGHRSNLPATHPYKSIEPFNREFLPSDLPNCLVWLDPADTRSLDLSLAGTPTIINNWYDRSGFSNTFVRGTISALTYEGPTYISNAQAFYSNGNNNLRATGNDALCNAVVSNLGANFGIYHIGCNTRSLTADFNDAIQIRTATSEYHVDVTGSNGPFGFGGASVTAAIGARTSSCNANVIYGCFFGSNYTDCRRNGHVFLGGRQGGNIRTAAANTTLFTIAGHTDNRQYTGTVNELILYNNINASYAYVPRIEQYLGRKYGTFLDLSGNNSYRFFPALTTAFNPLAAGYTDAFSTTIGCRLWLDAADSNTTIISVGQSIVSWLDKSGNARHAQNTAGAIPFRSTTAGGLPSIEFQSVFGHYLDLCDVANIVVNQNWSMFIVEERTSNNGQNYFFGGTSNATNTNLHVGYRSDSQATMAFYGNDINVTVPTLANDANLRVWSFIKDAAGKRVFANGILLGSDSATGNLTAWPNARIGRYETTSYYNGRICEILWYTNLPSNERRQVEGYLAHKWNRDLSMNDFHPYKYRVP